MKTIVITSIFFSLLSCAPAMLHNNISVQSGWIDDDIYTVIVNGTDEENAIARAKHQILKDVVDIRMRNNSRYTDIEKIREEFAPPLQNGIIIKKNSVPEGLQIYFQIREKGLKTKFQRI